MVMNSHISPGRSVGLSLLLTKAVPSRSTSDCPVAENNQISLLSLWDGHVSQGWALPSIESPWNQERIRSQEFLEKNGTPLWAVCIDWYNVEFSKVDLGLLLTLGNVAVLQLKLPTNTFQEAILTGVVIDNDACKNETSIQAGHLLLVKPYMIAIQSNNIAVVNEVWNEIYVEEDYERLRESIY